MLNKTFILLGEGENYKYLRKSWIAKKSIKFNLYKKLLI